MDVPVPRKVPPQLPEYQFQLAPEPSDPPETVSVVEEPGQIGLADAVIPVGAVDCVS